MRTKDYAMAAGIVAFLIAATWITMRISLTPEQRFIGDCSDTYPMIECWEEWQRHHQKHLPP